MSYLHYIITACVTTLLLSPSAGAVEALNFNVEQPFISTRAMGMGNAYTAVAADYSAMFYNPAALARRDHGQLHLFFRAGASGNYKKIFDDIQDVNEIENDTEKINEMEKLLQRNYGENYYLRATAPGGVWVRPNWGIALLPADVGVNIGIHQRVGPALNVNARADTTLAYAYARDFRWGEGHRLSVGATAKTVNRVHISESVTAGQLAQDEDVFDTNVATEGLTFDVDIGTLYTPVIPSEGFLSVFEIADPTFAFVVRNAGDYGYPLSLDVVNNKENSGEPPSLGRRFDFGSKWDLPNFWVFNPRFSFDIRDVGHENWSWKKGLHAGAELFWEMYEWWRGSYLVGVNQGYLTAGVQLKFAFFQLDVATWGEEVGTKTSPRESRRYMVEMSMDF